jgi:hypothetical protein
MTSQIGGMRAMQRQRTMLAILRGIFGTGTGVAIGSAAALSANRRVAADESGVGAAATEIMTPELFIETKALLGELGNTLANGAMFVHPHVLSSLEKADAVSFQTGIESGLPFTITTYRGVPVFVSDSLIRAGTTDGFVYDSYILSAGVFAKGEKAQVPDSFTEANVASLQFDVLKDPNTAYIWDRTRFVIHPNGLRFTATPAGQSATNPELAIPASWSLVYSSANRTGMACIVTNG